MIYNIKIIKVDKEELFESAKENYQAEDNASCVLVVFPVLNYVNSVCWMTAQHVLSVFQLILKVQFTILSGELETMPFH